MFAVDCDRHVGAFLDVAHEAADHGAGVTGHCHLGTHERGNRLAYNYVVIPPGRRFKAHVEFTHEPFFVGGPFDRLRPSALFRVS